MIGTPELVTKIVENQLDKTADRVLVGKIRTLLVTPYRIDRDWDYGDPGTVYPCWTVLEHRPSNTGIAYCEQGFGPSFPWGLVWLSGEHMNIGMDSSWYETLEYAFVESMAFDTGKNPSIDPPPG